MKIIARNLPVDVSYKIIRIEKTEGDNYSTCQNCDRVIRNIVLVESSDNKKYCIGTECAERLSGIHPSEIAEIKRKFTRIAKYKKIIKDLIKENDLLIEMSIEGDKIRGVWIHSKSTYERRWSLWKLRFTYEYFLEFFNEFNKDEYILKKYR